MRLLRDMDGKLVIPKREMQPDAPGWHECLLCMMRLPPEETKCPGCGHEEEKST